MNQGTPSCCEGLRHRFIDLDGIRVFVREAGQSSAPAVLLPHGYPCSSYEFRNFMPMLADRWHLIGTRLSRLALEGTINGVPQTTLEPDGRKSHWLKVDRKLREAAGADAGDVVTLEIAPTADEPEPKVPADL